MGGPHKVGHGGQQHHRGQHTSHNATRGVQRSAKAVHAARGARAKKAAESADAFNRGRRGSIWTSARCADLELPGCSIGYSNPSHADKVADYVKDKCPHIADDVRVDRDWLGCSDKHKGFAGSSCDTRRQAWLKPCLDGAPSDDSGTEALEALGKGLGYTVAAVAGVCVLGAIGVVTAESVSNLCNRRARRAAAAAAARADRDLEAGQAEAPEAPAADSDGVALPAERRGLNLNGATVTETTV